MDIFIKKKNTFTTKITYLFYIFTYIRILATELPLLIEHNVNNGYFFDEICIYLK